MAKDENNKKDKLKKDNTKRNNIFRKLAILQKLIFLNYGNFYFTVVTFYFGLDFQPTGNAKNNLKVS